MVALISGNQFCLLNYIPPWGGAVISPVPTLVHKGICVLARCLSQVHRAVSVLPSSLWGQRALCPSGAQPGLLCGHCHFLVSWLSVPGLAFPWEMDSLKSKESTSQSVATEMQQKWWWEPHVGCRMEWKAASCPDASCPGLKSTPQTIREGWGLQHHNHTTWFLILGSMMPELKGQYALFFVTLVSA
jgi:hypothetical protein